MSPQEESKDLKVEGKNFNQESKSSPSLLTLSSPVGEVVEEVFETNWDLEVDKFDNMGLNEKVLRGIYGYGFKDPSPIQTKGILPVIQGKDTIAQVSQIKDYNLESV